MFGNIPPEFPLCLVTLLPSFQIKTDCYEHINQPEKRNLCFPWMHSWIKMYL